jgi:hypothetical protein
VGDTVTAADGRGEPSPRRQLARRAEPAHVTDLGQDDQRGKRAHPRQLGQQPDPRVGPGTLADLRLQPAGPLLQRAGQAQVVVGYLAGYRGQLERGEPGPARAAPAPARPVITMVGDDGVDPVAQQRPQPHQPGAVPQQRPQLPHLRRGDPRLRQQAGAQQLRQDRRAGPCRFSAGPRRSPCTAASAPGAGRSRSPPAAPPATRCRTRPRTPSASPAASHQSPAESGSAPLGTFRFASTSPSASMTAT